MRRFASLERASSYDESSPSFFRYRARRDSGTERYFRADARLSSFRNFRAVSQTSPSLVRRAMFDRMCVESRRCFDVSIPSSAMIFSTMSQNSTRARSSRWFLARWRDVSRYTF
jgi:hypothetical protein